MIYTKGGKLLVPSLGSAGLCSTCCPAICPYCDPVPEYMYVTISEVVGCTGGACLNFAGFGSLKNYVDLSLINDIEVACPWTEYSGPGGVCYWEGTLTADCGYSLLYSSGSGCLGTPQKQFNWTSARYRVSREENYAILTVALHSNYQDYSQYLNIFFHGTATFSGCAEITDVTNLYSDCVVTYGNIGYGGHGTVIDG